MKFILTNIALLLTVGVFAQPYPSTQATRTTLPIKIDGTVDEEAWKQAPLITGLTEQRPNPGRRESQGNRSELFLLYDDEAIYFGGNLHETHKDSIAQQLG